MTVSEWEDDLIDRKSQEQCMDIHLGSSQIEFDSWAAWVRYLYWADVMRKQFEASSDGPTPFGPWFALGAHWYGSLYVVVEGWKELGLKDAIIDALLSHAAYPNLLRQFRNGVYHYQSKIMAPKLLQFIARTRHVLWV